MFPPPYFRRTPFVPYQPSPFRAIPPNFSPPQFTPYSAPIPNPTPSPNKLSQFLQTTEQFMKTAQNYQPYIQQARPLLKNLPAMWKLYKGFTGSSSNKSPSKRSSYSKNTNHKPSSTPTKLQYEYEENPSVPRIYQPPF